MKKFMKSLMLVAAVAMGFTACTNDLLDEVNTNTGNTFTLTISAEKPALEGTRTEFSNGSVIWSGVEKIRATYYHTSDVWSKYYASNQNPQIAADGSTATFSIDTQYPAQSAEGEYTFYAGYPQNAIGNSTNAPIDGVLAVTVPTEQTMPKMGTFDVTADIMVGKSLESYTEVIQTIPIYWTRLVSHVCVTLKNLAAEEGEVVKSVTLTAPESVMLTGAGDVNFVEQSMTTLDNNTVSVNLPANTVANVAELPVWFCSAPATIASGNELTITVETTRGTYTRTITARSEGIKFVQNTYSTLGVNMASAEFTPAAVSANVFQMITSVGELTTGEYVLAAKYNNAYYPMSTSFASKINAATTISVSNDQITESDAEGYVLTLTASGNNVSIYNGSQYLAYKSGTDFTTTTTASNWTVKYTDNQFQFLQTRYILWNYNSGNGRFGAYATSNWNTSNYSGLYLFKKVTNDPTAPTMSLDKSEISFEQAGGSATITATTTNYTGAITATSDNTHFTTSVEGNVVTVTAPANTEETVKTATITITAGTISKEVAVTQAANLGLIGKGIAESPYTVADALKLIAANQHDTSKDVYVEGIVSYIKEAYNATFGNANYNISDNGEDTNSLNIYRGFYIDGADFTADNQLSLGDKVVVKGKLSVYGTTSQFAQGSQVVSVVKAGGSDEPTTPVQLATPLVNAAASGNTITLTWAAIANATSYTVTYGTTTIENATSPCVISDLAYSTTYEFSVVAVGDGTNYTNSEAATKSATTEANPNIGGTTWTRVTDVNTLLAGGTFIIGYEASANSGVIVPLRSGEAGAKTTANGYFYSGTTSGSSTSSTINMTSVSDTSAYEVTISASTTVSGAINIQMSTGNYFGNNNAKNTGRLYTSPSANTAYVPTFGANDVVTLKCNAATSYHTLQYNTSSPRFANYNGGQKNVVIYKKN